ncbi:hypothetical protein [Protaetiibacter larvae]|uniref:DUF8094 domain-containing protein n=1 Tax=Protaetiibacter larvae TaxID=2592654 RepID=A0A5C1Y9Q3_9MICO|nr:hypothetical protein [Protaetiibacter larvae]QEO10536.1 hypothetical protein FLP23_11310 [Protaetiibacter larvae]
MRFVLAIVLFVVSFVAIGLGIAQRTIFLGPDHVTASVAVDGDAPFTVLDGAALNAHPGTQRIEVSGSGDVFIAIARTDDITAWIGDAPSTSVAIDEQGADLVASAHPGLASDAVSPVGSDLWIQEFTGTGTVAHSINVPADVSLLIASDGEAAAPADISITWPLKNATPWSGPLVIGGVAVLLAGLIVLIWALVHARRRRGPRRKTPKMPKPPRPAQLRPAPRRPAITAGGPEPTAHGRRRAFVAVPLLLVGALALSACTADGSAVPTASPSATDAAVAAVDPPVVTKGQFTRIVSAAAESVAGADEARDATLAAERLAGPALELRTANYAARGADGAITATPAFPTGSVSVILPQQRHEWPRVVFAAVSGVGDDSDAEYGLMFVQETPRDTYKVHYLVRLTQSVPEVAPVDLGAARLGPDNKLLAYTPDQLASEYGDILINGDASAYTEHFDAENDLLRETFGADYKTQRRGALPNAVIDFTSAVGGEEPYAFATNDTGAIVAVDLRETETVRPAEAGAAVSPTGAVKALSGKQTTTKGIAAEYGMQVLFYVPALTASDQKIRVLGFTQGLVAASEVP